MSKYTRLLKQVEEHLDTDESILGSVMGVKEVKIMGNDNVRNGIFVATERRLVFYAKRVFGFDIESFAYRHVSSIEMGKNLMGSRMTFFASGNQVSMKWISSGDVPAFIETVRERIEVA